jgi:hypothetical protein
LIIQPTTEPNTFEAEVAAKYGWDDVDAGKPIGASCQEQQTTLKKTMYQTVCYIGNSF